ncbi:MAG: T9SS type A sorting domain-containing protein [Bacteroidales bacterium]|nr:T9SS type A sorting domain-containing protein [Bacteroidales bacterium]
MEKTQFLLLRFVLLLFLISGLKAASAQTWPMPGAHWTYCITLGPSPAGSTEMTVTGDTVINGYTYNIIEHLDNNENKILYTRYSNDTVYRFVNEQEYIFFTYNLDVGDIYTTFRSLPTNWSDSTCSSTMPLKVINSEMVELDGEMLQQWTLRDTLYDDLYGNDALRIDYTLIQRIGIINSYPFINPTAGGDCIPIIDGPKHSLGTYEDDSFYYMFELCEGSGVGDEMQSSDRIRITPNPARDFFEIEFLYGRAAREYYARLFDVTGHEILSTQISKENSRIDVSGIKPGFYMIRLHSPNNKSDVIAKPLIKE